MSITYTPALPVAGDTITLTSSLAGAAPTRWVLGSQPSGAHVVQGTAAAVADYAALRRVAATERAEGQTRLVEATDALWRWVGGTRAGTADDGATVVRPNDVALADAGRWILLGAVAQLTGSTFVPTRAGEYVVTALNYRYTYDPGGVRSGDVVLFGTESRTIHVATRVELPIVTTSGDGATLRCTIMDATVKAAELVEPTSEKARIATLDTATVAALAAMVDVTVASAGEDLIVRVKDLRAKFNAHVGTGGGGLVHASADTVNPITREPADALRSAIEVLGEASDRYLAHAMAGSSGGTWHSNDDAKNVPVTAKPAPGDLGAAIVHEADLSERCYERHRVLTASPTAHISSDATNTLSAPTTLSATIVAYLDALAAQDPTAAAGEVEGAADWVARYGGRAVG